MLYLYLCIKPRLVSALANVGSRPTSDSLINVMKLFACKHQIKTKLEQATTWHIEETCSLSVWPLLCPFWTN